MKPAALDVITIGRSSVDLYGQQVGGRLEDMASFSKAVGGCPANIAIGTARLGLRSGLITRVGDEAMGRFIREQMEREAVATHGILSGPAVDRLKNAPINEIVLTNTLPIPPEKQIDGMTVLSIAPLIGRAIREVFEDGSVTSLFDGAS